MGPLPDTTAVLRALVGGPATLDALAARLGGADRDGLVWALREVRERGLATVSGGEECGPDGLCGTSAPAVHRLTPDGAAAARAA